MKKIVGGLLYDTENSIIVHHQADTNRNLYQTQNGNFFMFYPNGQITPKSIESTMDYLGKYDIDKYIELFGEPQEA